MENWGLPLACGDPDGGASGASGRRGVLTWKRQRGEARKTRTTRLCDRDVVVSLVLLGVADLWRTWFKWTMLQMNHLNHLLPQNTFFGGQFFKGQWMGMVFHPPWVHEVGGPWAKVTLKFQGNQFFLNKCLRWVLPSLYWVHYIDKSFHKSQLQWRVANCIDLVVFYRILSYPLNDVNMLYFVVGGCFWNIGKGRIYWKDLGVHFKFKNHEIYSMDISW